MVDIYSKHKPLLTIGIPAFNEERYISKTLDSILAQKFTDFIVYICDDCSSDNTVEIIKNYLFDPRLKLLTSETKTTFVVNWVKSLKASESKYFAWIGAHDILHPDYFLEALNILEENPSVTLVYPQSVEIDADDVQGNPTDSDIDTTGLTTSDALLKVAHNLNYCTAIHGIFKASELKKIPVKHIMGFDFLILLLTPIYGEIRKTKNVTFYRRVVRRESEEDRIRRWETSGMFKKSKHDPFAIIARYLASHYLRSKQKSIIYRLFFLNKLSGIFRLRFKVNKKMIVKSIAKI